MKLVFCLFVTILIAVITEQAPAVPVASNAKKAAAPAATTAASTSTKSTTLAASDDENDENDEDEDEDSDQEYIGVINVDLRDILRLLKQELEAMEERITTAVKDPKATAAKST